MYVLVDYGMGNLFSVEQAFIRIGVTPEISSIPEVVERASVIILPGVGAYPDAVRELQEKGLWDVIQKKVKDNTPLIGICLGMQLLYEYSDEMGKTEGLGLLNGHIRRFSGKTKKGDSYKVPHMGWNTLHITKEDPELLKYENEYVYYVHSYYAANCIIDECLATSLYGDTIVPGIVGKGNILGMQFHPEKSSDIGSLLLKDFCNKVEKEKRGLSL